MRVEYPSSLQSNTRPSFSPNRGRRENVAPSALSAAYPGAPLCSILSCLFFRRS
jgi:hypothetical protein